MVTLLENIETQTYTYTYTFWTVNVIFQYLSRYFMNITKGRIPISEALYCIRTKWDHVDQGS